MFTIFVSDCPCRFKIGDAAHVLCFLTGFVYPVVALVVNRDMLRSECGDIGKCKSGQRTEYKDVAYHIEPLHLKILFHKSGKLLLRKKFAGSCFCRELDSLKGVYFHPVVVEREAHDFLQVLAVFVRGILLGFLVNFEEDVEIAHKLVVDGTKRHILDIVVLLHKLAEITLGAFIAQYSTQHHIADFKQLAILGVLLPEYLAQHLGLLGAPLISVHHSLGIDRLALVNQLLMDAVDPREGGVEVVIEFD